MKVTMKKERFEKKPNTKNSFSLVKTEEKDIHIDLYKNIVNKDTLRWFRRLGGSETAQRSYTCRGYLVTRLISKNPDRSVKVIRTFTFE